MTPDPSHLRRTCRWSLVAPTSTAEQSADRPAGDVEEPSIGRPADQRSTGRRDPVSARSTLGRKVVVLVVLLAAVAALTDLWRPWTPDDGSYAVATRLVRDHDTWHLPAEPTWAGDLGVPSMVNGTVTDEGVHPYVRQPAWIVTLVGTTSVVPEPYGFYVVQALAAVAAACLAWAVARRVNPASADIAFWAAGGAPLVVWAFGLWAHAPVAAAGGLAAYGLVRFADPDRRLRLFAVGCVAVAGALATSLRTEGLVLAVAAAITVGWLGWTDRRDAATVARTWSAAWPSVLVLAGGLAARFVSSAWTGQIATGAAASGGGLDGAAGSFIGGRLSGALATLASTGDAAPGAVVMGMIALVAAVLAGRRVATEGRVDGTALAFAAGWTAIVVARSLMHPTDHLSGLLVAAPFVTVGLLCVRRADLERAEKALVVFVAWFTLGVLATQYSKGGGHEWGGRFLSGALVALVVVAASAFVRRAPATGDRSADGTRTAFLGLVVLVPALLGVVVTQNTRLVQHEVIEPVEKAAPSMVVSTSRIGAHIAWPTQPETTWLRTEPEDLIDYVGRAVAAGETDITLFLGEQVDRSDLAALGCTVEDLSVRVLRLTC